MTLPLCEHRGDLVTLTAPNSGAVRQVYECDQIHTRGLDLVAHVSAAACGDCGYSNEKFDTAMETYRPASPDRPSASEFAARWGHCGICQHRTANFCDRSLGVCSLSQKLAKSDFECPIGNFGRIERQ